MVIHNGAVGHNLLGTQTFRAVFNHCIELDDGGNASPFRNGVDQRTAGLPWFAHVFVVKEHV